MIPRWPVTQAEQWPFTVLAVVIAVLGGLSLVSADLAVQSERAVRRIGGWAISGFSGLAALVYLLALVRKAIALRPPTGRDIPEKLPDDVLDRRRLVWQALSDLFLDSHLDDADHRGIARGLVESGYDWPELDSIMVTEVAPVLHGNLRMVAGQWGTFELDWLEGRILRHMGRQGHADRARRQERYLMELIADDWNGVERHFRAFRGDRRE